MEKLETPLQVQRKKRNEAIFKLYNETFMTESSITEWCKIIAKKYKCSY